MASPLSPSLSPALPLLLALLCATPGLGGPGVRCGVSPQNWCQSWETALSCGALGHCVRLAWAPPGADLCSDCQQIVTLLTRMANDSATKAAVEGFLRRECAALPVPTMVSPCQSLVHQLYGVMLGHLQGHLKPSVVCARLELCPGDTGGSPLLPPLGDISAHLQVPSGATLPVPLPLCWLCRTFLSRAEAAVPKEAVAAAVTRMCRVLPLVAVGACQCLAQRYAALALEVALGRLGPRVLCHFLLSCRPGDTGDGVVAALLGDSEALAPGLGDSVDPPQGCDGGKDVPTLSPNPCALGPPYWCSSPAAARRCQALQHCQEHVWL